MTTDDLATAATLTDTLADLADEIEGALERSGWRGSSPARVARRFRCSTADARHVLAHLAGCQRAHIDRSWRHTYAGPA